MLNGCERQSTGKTAEMAEKKRQFICSLILTVQSILIDKGKGGRTNEKIELMKKKKPNQLADDKNDGQTKRRRTDILMERRIERCTNDRQNEGHIIRLMAVRHCNDIRTHNHTDDS